MKILNFGSLNIDYVYDVEHFVRPGETLSSHKMEIFCGGKGLNQSIALARAGADVYHAGAVGEKDGKILIDTLAENNINTEFIKIHDAQSGHALIQVDSSGQNCIILYGGTNQMIDKEHIDFVFEHFSQGDYILLQNEINMLDYIMTKAHDKGMVIVLNPSPMQSNILDLPLENLDYLILNEVEASDLCGKEAAEDILDALTIKFPNTKIILTLGKQGAIYSDGEVRLKHGIYKVPAADTTAAGDTFTGYFFASILNNSPEEALRIASMASAIAVSRKGAEASIPKLQEVLTSNFEYKNKD
ncbi:MAG: ribokinase [Tyzzerella sp.]|nr:ribokinase [Tyzzerella sp.]